EGVAMVEFRWNRKTDEWIFVEINGRFWGSLPLAIASGADFPKFLYQLRVEGIQEFPRQYNTGICCRNWELDKNWLTSRGDAGAGRLSVYRRVTLESALAVCRAVGGRERSDTLASDDLRPGLA